MSMKDEANEILNEAQRNDHKENMRLWALIHNAMLLVFTTILCCVFYNAWLLLLLLLWDFSYNNGSKKEAKKDWFTIIKNYRSK